MTTMTSIVASVVGIAGALTVVALKTTAYCMIVPAAAGLSIMASALMARHIIETI